MQFDLSRTQNQIRDGNAELLAVNEEKSTTKKKYRTRIIWYSEFKRKLSIAVKFADAPVKPNTHRRRRRDETVESRRVGGVYTNSQLVGDSFVVSLV